MANGTDQRARFPYLNRAVVVIDGSEYFEWETVAVRLAKREVPANTFRFTCSEQEPIGTSWAGRTGDAMRIIPGQKCQVYLDGYLAIDGEVITRRAHYDAQQHVVEIQGQGRAGRLAEASVPHKTGEFNNINFQQLAQKIVQPFGIGVTGKAGSDQQFKRVSLQPGESAWELLERYARASNTVLGETNTGQLELGTAGGGGSAIEGVNILIGQETIHSLKAVGSGEPEAGGGEGSDFKSMGQAPGSDDAWGADPTHQRQSEQGGITSDFSSGFLPKINLSEIPAWSNDQMLNRAKMESGFADSLQIWVTVTLLSWQHSAQAPPSGGLWRPGEMVTVNSPMLVMYGRSLILKAVTFTQDDSSGTRSTLELLNPAALGGEPEAK